MDARANAGCMGLYLRILVWVLEGARGDINWMAYKLQDNYFMKACRGFYFYSIF